MNDKLNHRKVKNNMVYIEQKDGETSAAHVESVKASRRPPRARPHRIYVVRRGDTLRGIARRFGVSVENIIFMNNLRRPIIHVGQRLRIPIPIAPL